MKTKVITLTLFLIASTIFAQDGWKTLEKDNYSIIYPEDWVSSDEKPQPSVQFLISANINSQKEDLFRESVNMVTEALNGQKLTIEAYAKISLDQITGQIPSAKVSSNKDVKLGDKDAREVIWSADFGNGMILKFKQVFTINNDIAYVLTYTATTAEYNIYNEVANKMIYSFKLTK